MPRRRKSNPAGGGQNHSTAQSRLKDVARLAGVSTATVSRSVNNPQTVSAPLRERIEQAIAQLNWVPHASARALATSRTLTIGAVVPTLANEHFADSIQTLQEAVEAAGYTLFISCSEYDPQREVRQVRKMIERGVDGMVLVGEQHLPELYTMLDAHGLPLVNIFTYSQDSPHTCVGVDNHRAVYNSVTYLLDQGHTRFGMLMQDPLGNDRALARTRGAVDALASRNLVMRPEHQAIGLMGIADGRRLFHNVMTAPDRPTAVICANGHFGMAAMMEAAAMGLAVPEDVSIISFDDFEIMSHMPISISAIRVPSGEIGRRTAKILIGRLTNQPNEVNGECEAEFSIRASSGPVPVQAASNPATARSADKPKDSKRPQAKRSQ